MTNIAVMLQKAQKMKQRMTDMHQKVQQMEIAGDAGGGLVTCRLTGRFELRMLKVDPKLINPAEADVMEDMIIAAVNDARNKAEKLMAEETQKIMDDLGLPPGLELPF